MDSSNIKRTQKRLAAARGEHPVDLLLTNAQVVNVYNGKIERFDVAVFDEIVVGFGEYKADRVINLDGLFLAPGFIESHIHIESSKLTPQRFNDVVIPHGTTSVVADPHEIANVWGIEGIRYMMRNTRKSVLDVFYMLPSCVPATAMETAGAEITAEDMKILLSEPDVIGIGELMNFPGAFLGDSSVLAKVSLAGGSFTIDGHAPGLRGKNLSAYLLTGVATDHECTDYDEASEKLGKGMRILIREGSTAKNLQALLPLITPSTERRLMFVSDDKRPGDLLEQGHLDFILRKAVKAGLDPLTAIRMVTLNPAETYKLHDRGGIRPGAIADIVALSDLESFDVKHVWKKGKHIVSDGRIIVEAAEVEPLLHGGSLPVPQLTAGSLAVADKGKPVRVIGLVPNQIVTKCLTATLPAEDGRLTCDLENDIIKLAVIERYSGSGNMSIGFVKGFGIKQGALASTVAHDSHNIIVTGSDDLSILTAVHKLIEIGGGQVAVSGENILAELPLPVAGLMSDMPAEDVAACERQLINAAGELGCVVHDPFMALSFLALPVIPELKLTDKGLVDVSLFQHVPLYV